jgi:two-component sensor histidine kinase
LEKSLLKQNKLQEIEIEQKRNIQQGLERENNLKKIELLKKDELNQVLTAQNGLMNDNAKKDSIIRVLMIAGLIILLVFVINYYKNYKIQHAANKKIAKQGEDLKSLIYELNHRVKNNFQMVVAMLQIQSRSIKDSEIADILIQTSNRFQAISRVHEKLYQVDALDNTYLIDYLKDLVNNISTHYSLKSANYNLNAIDDNHLKINMESVVPLALIVNELATNSFKHGFMEGKKLQISIQIIKLDSSKYKLLFKDNGPGISENYHQANSFGLKLIKLFVEQLHGSLAYKNNNGLETSIEFEQ